MDEAITRSAEVLWAFQNIATPNPGPADLLIGLGSYQLTVADKAADLLRRHVAPRLLFCGSQGNWTRSRWSGSEAQRFRERAIECGADPGRIDIEAHSTNLGENLGYARSYVEMLMPNVQSVVIVTKANTTLRVALTKEIKWPEVVVQYSAPDLHWTQQAVAPMTTDDVVCELVGDLAAILD